MARKLRLEFPGACYHVINRGNYRKDIFGLKGAADGFERCLFETAVKFGWRLHAFVVMRNHFHVAVETPEPNLSLGMKWLQGTWAMRFNRFRGETGRPFQGRYKALHVEPGHSLAQVCHYIHLNPLRAKVVTPETLGSYRHSSLAWFLRKDRPDCLVAETVLAEAGGLASTPAGWRRYFAYLDVLAEEEAKLREDKFGRLSRGWMIGTAEYGQALQKDYERIHADLGEAHLLGAGAIHEWRETQWEKKLVAAARHLRVDLAALPPRKSAARKVQLAAIMKVATSASNAWLAQRLCMGTPASVSQYVRRFRLARGGADRSFQSALSQVMT